MGDQLLRGCLSSLPEQKSRAVRIFTSSTFTDTAVERNALIERVYPKLKEYCRSEYGLDFMAVDMRWGVRDESSDNHITTSLCMSEIKNCQRLSIGPTFVSFLCQKYGYRPFPPIIVTSELDLIKEELVKNGKSIQLFEDWFERDDNSIPPTYNLRTISSKLYHYHDNESLELQKRDRDSWWKIFEELQLLLRLGSSKCSEKGTMTKEQTKKYFISVTNDEVNNGLNEYSRKDTCLLFIRVFEDLKDHLNDKEAKNFIDLKPDSTLDEEAYNLLQDEINEASNTLPSNHVFKTTLKWNPKGVNTQEVSEHKEYIDSFCEKFYTSMITLIDKGMREKALSIPDDPLLEEILQHSQFCVSHCKSFHGREDALTEIGNYIQECFTERQEGQVISPFVIHGESGCGKTSLVAKAIYEASKKYTSNNVITIVRFLGTTPSSSVIKKVLTLACEQLCHIFGISKSDIPQGKMELIDFFGELLKRANKENPILICLDSLDQLSNAEGAHKMTWLPKTLPPYVAFIVSTLPNEFNCLATLKSYLPKTSKFCQISPLPLSVGWDIMNYWLKSSSRTLTPIQKEKVQEALQGCSLPLYVKLVFNEVKKWKSSTPDYLLVLPPTIKGLIHSLFQRLEREYGKILISHALGFITLSTGITESELDDLLSIDDDVLQDVFQYWLPPTRRIPPILWTRIRNELGEYLVERDADNSLVIYWYHRQFIEVVRERYLCKQHFGVEAGTPEFSLFGELSKDFQNEFCKQLHSLCADYYLGLWNGREKPFIFSEKQMKTFGVSQPKQQADRKVPGQPFLFNSWDDAKIHFNHRTLSKLSLHLIMSERIEELKKHALCNYEFLLAKLCAQDISKLHSDFNTATHVINDLELRLVQDTFRLSSLTIYENPKSTLAPEIIGRLLGLATRHPEFTHLRKLVEDAMKAGEEFNVLLPTHPCFSVPGGMLQSSLEISGQSIAISPNGLYVASSNFGGVKIWDLEIGILLHQIKSTPPIPKLLISPNSKLLLFYSHGSRNIKIWKLDTAELVQSFNTFSSQYSENQTIQFTVDDQFLVVAGEYDGQSNVVIVMKIETGELVHKFQNESEIRDLNVSQDSKSTQLVTSCTSSIISGWKIEDGSQAFKIEHQKENEVFTKFVMTSNGSKIITSKRNYETSIYSILIFDTSTQQLLATIAEENFIGQPTSMVLSSNNELLCFGDKLGKVKVVEINQGTIRHHFHTGSDGNQETIVSFIDDQSFAFASQYQTHPSIHLLTNGKLVTKLPSCVYNIIPVIVNGKPLIITRGERNAVQTWNLENISLLNDNQGNDKDGFQHHHPDGVTTLSLFNNATQLISADPQEINFWNISDGKLLKTLLSPTNSTTFIVSPNNKIGIGYSTWNQLIEVWNLETLTFEKQIDLDFKPKSVCISSDSALITFFIDDKPAQVYQLDEWKKVREFEIITSNLFYQTNDFLLLPSKDESGTYYSFNPLTGDSLKFEKHSKSISFIASSKDQSYVLSSSADGSLIYWDLSDALHPSPTILETGEEITYITFNSQQTLFATLSSSYISVWDSKSKTKLHQIHTKHSQTRTVTFSTDSQYIFGNAWDNYVYIYSLQEKNYIGQLNLHAGIIRLFCYNNQVFVSLSNGQVMKLKYSH